MLSSHVATLGGALYRRATDDFPQPDGPPGGGGGMGQLPGWAVIVFFADFLFFFPLFIYIGYTLSHIYPTLAIIEDPQPPEYTPVDLNAVDPNDPAAELTKPAPALTTTSFRRINRLLNSTAGWTSNFRGILCAALLGAALNVCGLLFEAIPFVPRAVGVLLASLATVQLSTAWTHIVISAPSPLRFLDRLPPFRKTFEATWVPVCIYWAATQFTAFLVFSLSGSLGLFRSAPDLEVVWKSLLTLVVFAACLLLLVIPAHTVLVRVQASLLPPDEDTIVPFDRSFGGHVEPAVITGKGYVDFMTAWRTFTRESWVRLYKLLGKIALAVMAAYCLVLAVTVPEFLLMASASRTAGSR